MQGLKPVRTVAFGFKFIGLAGLAVCIAGALVAAKPVPQTTAKEQIACAACHEDMAKAFDRNPHKAAGATACASCHVGANKHVDEGGGANILAYKTTDLPTAKTKACLACHADDQSHFLAGPHGKANLDCTSCHNIHAAKSTASLLKVDAAQSCASCHEDVMAKFNFSERHRLREGILTCTTCHDPHAPATGERLGGFKQEACLKCHTDKGGPFLFEHGSSRVEGCTICHEPHGSPNRHLLITQSISDLCFSCHTFAPAFHKGFDSRTTNCTSCHSTIHGSNLSRIFIK